MLFSIFFVISAQVQMSYNSRPKHIIRNQRMKSSVLSFLNVLLILMYWNTLPAKNVSLHYNMMPSDYVHHVILQ